MDQVWKGLANLDPRDPGGFYKKLLLSVKTCGATRNPEFPRNGPDRIETGPESRDIFKNIFGSVRVGVFLSRYETFFPGFGG